MDAGTNFVGNEFVNNARILAIEIEEIPVKAHHLIGKVERYHGPIRRAFEIITADLDNDVISDNALQMAVKAVKDTAGPNGLVPTLLLFETYPRLSLSLPPFPSITARAAAVRKAMAEVRKLKAERQMAEVFATRNGPSVAEIAQLPLQNEVRIWRKNGGWAGPFKLIAHNNSGNACIINVNGKPTNFRITSVRSYYRNEHTATIIPNDVSNNSDNTNDEYHPKPAESIAFKRKRGRPPGSKNKPKIAIANITDVFMAQKKRNNAKLAVKLRQKGKITTPGKSFELLNQTEIDALIGNEIFRFK
jgi:hypothetical protein